MTRDLGLLLLRVGPGLLLAFAHGLGKVTRVLQGNFEFADPIGIGAAPSLVLAALAEFVCALLVAAGFKTRWAAVPVVVTMLVAAFIVHADDPFRRQEFPLLFAIAFGTLILTGGGKYSLDSLLKRR